MAEEHDDWMSGLGVNISALRDAASSAVQTVADTASEAVQAASDTASSAAETASNTIQATAGGTAESSVASTAANAVSQAATAAENIPAGAALASASDGPGVIETAKVFAGVIGEVTGVSSAVRKVEDAASSAAQTAENVATIAEDHPLDTAAGVAFGVVQGLAPGGFVLPSPDPKSQAFELGRGVGMIGGGIAAVALGSGEEITGIGADATGAGAVVGVPLNIIGAVTVASGATATAAGAATIANAMSMGGGGGSSGSADSVSFENPITNHGNRVSAAEGKVASVESSLAEETETVTNDESMMDALEGQKRSGTFDPKVGAFEGQVQKDVDLLRRSGTTLKDVKDVQAEVAAVADENVNLAKDIELAADVDRTISTEKADRNLRTVSALSKRLSNLTARLGPAEDEALDLQVRVQKLGERLKKL